MTGWITHLHRPPVTRGPVEREDAPRPRHRRWLARDSERARLRSAVGLPVFLNTTTLQTAAGPLGPWRPALDAPNLVWSLWAPLTKILVDVFPTTLPAEEELAFRQSLAETHGLTYAVVAPGFTLTIDDLEELVASKEERA